MSGMQCGGLGLLVVYRVCRVEVWVCEWYIGYAGWRFGSVSGILGMQHGGLGL